ncbi:MAG: glycosyltransferase family 39 protein [Bacteroidota bacterium]
MSRPPITYIKEQPFLIGIICIGVLLRFIPINEYQLAHDELSALSRSVFPNLKQTIQYGVQYADTHPVFVQLFLYFWTKLFGLSEIAIKIPFLLCGTGVIIAGYNFSKKWFGTHAGLLTAVFFACSFIFCVYSSYARMYITGILFSIGCVHFLFNILYDEKSGKTNFIYFGLCCLLCGYNNHLNSLFAFTCAGIGLFLVSKKQLKWYLITCLFTILCYLPILPITLTQLQMGGLGAKEGGWLPPPKPTAIIDFLFGTGFAGILNGIILISVIIASFIKRKAIEKKQWLLLILFFINYFIIYFYSVYKSPILQFSVLLFSGTCALFFLTSFAQSLSRAITYAVCGISSVAMVCQLTLNKAWFDNFQKHEFDNMTAESYRAIELYGQKNVSSIYNAENYFIVHYLLKHHKAIHYKLGTDTIVNSAQSFRSYLSKLNSKHLVLGNFNPLNIEIAKEYFPYTESISHSYFFNTITLCKDALPKNPEDDHVIGTYDVLKTNTVFNLETQLKPEQGSYRLVSTCGEFPFALKTNFNNLKADEGQWLFVKLKFREDSINVLKDDMLSISINTKDSTKNYFTSSHFSNYHFNKKTNWLYCQAFVGSDIDEWNKSGELTIFIWKKDKGTLYIDDLTISKVDYSPLRFKVWK